MSISRCRLRMELTPRFKEPQIHEETCVAIEGDQASGNVVEDVEALRGEVVDLTQRKENVDEPCYGIFLCLKDLLGLREIFKVMSIRLSHRPVACDRTFRHEEPYTAHFACIHTFLIPLTGKE